MPATSRKRRSACSGSTAPSARPAPDISLKGKKRLDALLVERGLAETRAKAQALILAGTVWSDDKKLDKAGAPVSDDIPLELKGRDHPWVSRGGIKLAHALDHFGIDVTGAIALDLGASTGGFTDVLLSKGAAKVYAVDVGHGQLAWKLRQDPRVIVRERLNARYLTATEVPEPPDLVVCDASFIGLETLLPASLALAKPGVVRDPALHREVCERISQWLGSIGWQVDGIAESPIRGPEGNVEFLIHARR
jgi:23S rRNA (cytidine1920-2'-O)/16S rRNA (cytidine1409-2'-O)-methyltransferase